MDMMIFDTDLPIMFCFSSERFMFFLEQAGAQYRPSKNGDWFFPALILDHMLKKLIEKGFTLGVGAPEMHGESLIEIAHSGKFVLVDGSGGIRGYYDSDVPGLDVVFRDAIRALEHSR